MTFTGKTLNYNFFYPFPTTPVEGADFGAGDLTVDENVEFTGRFYSIDIGSNYVRFEFIDTGIFKTNGTFNGAVFQDVSGDINSMTRIRLQTNMSGLNRDDILVSAQKLSVNFAGTAFTDETYVHISVTFTQNLLVGTSGAESLTGTAAADKIKGKGGDDVLRGESDLLAAGDSAKGSVTNDTDWLIGGSGIDRFVFATGDTARQRARADVIADFDSSGGEIIDFIAWDADTTLTGHQHFTFVGEHSFTGRAGELRYTVLKGTTYLEGDTNGDQIADLAIRMPGAGKLGEENILL